MDGLARLAAVLVVVKLATAGVLEGVSAKLLQ
jgi:hypothetical protein